MDRDGQAATASRSRSHNSAAGRASSSRTSPSSPWPKTAGAASTHCAAPTQRSWSTVTRIGRLPDRGQLVHAVDGRLAAERQLLQRDREPQTGQPPRPARQHRLQLGPGPGLSDALVHAEPEGDVLVLDGAADVELVGPGERGPVAVGGQQGDDHALAGADPPTTELDFPGGDPG